ncbi:MAG TPA: alpha/beta hydrolase [Casimicrobiaceae bacterium]
MTTHRLQQAGLSGGWAHPAQFAGGPGYFTAGTGTPVVMLHASLGSKSQWAGLAVRLASRFRVIAVDLCGYGDNAMPGSGSGFTLDEEVRLVMSRLDGLLHPRVRFHVVGHSYGGLVALRLAALHAEQVASLALYDPVAFGLLGDDPVLADIRQREAEVVTLVGEGRRREAAQRFVDFWSGPGSYASQPEPMQLGIARRVAKVPLDFRAAWSWPSGRADLRAVRVPTLLLAGSRSPAVAQRIVMLLTETLRGCRVGWFDAGHMGPITDPQRINPWIEAFVDLCDESGSSAGRSPGLASTSDWAAAAD